MLEPFNGPPPDAHLVEVATLKVDIGYFEGRFGIRFSKDYDDLDYFIGALVTFDGFVCGLSKRLKGMDGMLNVSFPSGDKEVFNRLDGFLRAACLSENDVVWRNDRYFEVPSSKRRS